MSTNPVTAFGDYALRHLVEHLVQAGRSADLYRLLTLETADGGNAWHEAKSALHETATYVDDVGNALRDARRTSPTHDCRSESYWETLATYSLMLASINSQATALPAELLVALVRANIWSESQAIAHASRSTQVGVRVAALAGLAAEVRGPNGERAFALALDAARAIENQPSERMQAFLDLLSLSRLTAQDEVKADATAALSDVALMDRIPPHDTSPWIQFVGKLWYWLADTERSRTLETALGVLARSSDPYFLANGLISLLPYFDPAERSKRLSDVSRALPAISGVLRDYTLWALADRLVDLGLLADAIESASKVEEHWMRAQVLGDLCGRLPRHYRRIVISMARELETESVYGDPRLLALAAMAEHLPPFLRQQIVQQALSESPNKHPKEFGLGLLAMLFKFFPPDRRENALEELVSVRHSLEDGHVRHVAFEAIGKIANYLTRAELVSALTRLMIIDRRADQGSVGRVQRRPSAVPSLRSIEELAAHSHAVADPERKISVILENVTQLQYADRLAAFRDVLSLVKDIDYEASQSETLRRITSELPDELVVEAVRQAQDLPTKDRRGGRGCPRDDALASLLPRLAEAESVEDAFEMTIALTEDDMFGFGNSPKATSLAKLSRLLPPSLLDRAEMVARSMAKPYWRSMALSSIASAQTVSGRVSRAQSIVRTIEDDYWRCIAMIDLSLSLPGPLRDGSLAYVREVGRHLRLPDQRAEVLTRLARHLPPEDRGPVAIEAFGALSEVRAVQKRLELLSMLQHEAGILRAAQACDVLLGVLDVPWLRDRSTLANELRVVEPLVGVATGTSPAPLISRSIDRVQRWWP